MAEPGNGDMANAQVTDFTTEKPLPPLPSPSISPLALPLVEFKVADAANNVADEEKGNDTSPPDLSSSPLPLLSPPKGVTKTQTSEHATEAAPSTENRAGDKNESKETLSSSPSSLPFPWPSPQPLEEVEEILSYKFNNMELLEEALTHQSYPDKEFCYNRLEYLGDTVLNLLITKEQFFKYPDLQPGKLTPLRSVNVDTEKLARVALKHGLHKYLVHRMPVLDEQIKEFTHDISHYPLHSNGMTNPPKVLADIVESIIGAVFIDSKCSNDVVWTVFKPLLKPVIEQEDLKMNPLAKLYELCQKRRWNIEHKYENGWKYNMYIQGKLIGTSTYKLKKEIALIRAADDALMHISTVLKEDDENNDDK